MLTDTDQAFASALSTQYDLLGVLGRGGMGTVYKAHDKRLDHIVAIKIIHSQTDEIAIKRLRAEGHALAESNHPNIVRVLRFEQIGSLSVLAMEFVDGTDLAKLIAQRGTLTAAECRSVLQQACDALEQAHNRGIVHRDLKPSNILVTESGGTLNIKIADFGIARFIDGEEQRLTKTGAVVGTPEYISPEVCRGEKADQRSDIYSLGCILYTCITGKPPFIGDSAYEVIFNHMNERVPPAHCKQDPGLSAIVAKCTEPAPADRFQSIADLKAAANTGRAFRYSSARKSKMPFRLKRRVLAIVGISVAAISVSGMIIAFRLANSVNPKIEVDRTVERVRLKGEIIDAIQSHQPADELFAKLKALPIEKEDRAPMAEIYKNAGLAYRDDAIAHNDVRAAEASFAQFERSSECWPEGQTLCDEPSNMGILLWYFPTKDFYNRALTNMRAQLVTAGQSAPVKRLRTQLQIVAVASVMHDKDQKDHAVAQIRKSFTDAQVLDFIVHLNNMDGPKDDLLALAIKTWPEFPFHSVAHSMHEPQR
jgi:serine/threonine protein kinase